MIYEDWCTDALKIWEKWEPLNYKIMKEAPDVIIKVELYRHLKDNAYLPKYRKGMPLVIEGVYKGGIMFTAIDLDDDSGFEGR